MKMQKNPNKLSNKDWNPIKILIFIMIFWEWHCINYKHTSNKGEIYSTLKSKLCDSEFYLKNCNPRNSFQNLNKIIYREGFSVFLSTKKRNEIIVMLWELNDEYNILKEVCTCNIFVTCKWSNLIPVILVRQHLSIGYMQKGYVWITEFSINNTL